jgi:hypothetical protein
LTGKVGGPTFGDSNPVCPVELNHLCESGKRVDHEKHRSLRARMSLMNSDLQELRMEGIPLRLRISNPNLRSWPSVSGSKQCS